MHNMSRGYRAVILRKKVNILLIKRDAPSQQPTDTVVTRLNSSVSRHTARRAVAHTDSNVVIYDQLDVKQAQ